MKNADDILNSLTQYEPALHQFLTKRVGCSHTAADIFQKMAEKLLGQKSASPISNHRAYLYQAARNEVVNHYRFEHKRSQYEADCAATIGELDHRDAERITIANDSLSVLSAALDELPQLTRQIFILYRVNGFKQAVIAKQLGLNLSTVEKRLAIAMKFCRSRLREHEIYGNSPPQTSPLKEQ